MTHEQARRWLQAFARQWNHRVHKRTALQALSLALLVGVFACYFFTVHICFALAFSSFGIGWRLLYEKNLVDARRLARHLNRTVLALEESCELLFKPASALNLLETLQSRRLLHALAQEAGHMDMPRVLTPGATKFVCTQLSLALILALGIVFLQKLQTRSEYATTAPLFMGASKNSHSAARLTSVEIEIFPPAYTGKPRRTATDFNLTIEENALVAWHLAFDQTLARGALLLNGEDTLALQALDSTHFSARMQARENAFYQFTFQGRGQSPQSSDYFRIEIIDDAIPKISVDTLASRTVIAPGRLPVLNLQVRVEDDYGVTQVEAFATLARGTGESVRFREAKLDFAKINEISTREWQLQTTLDLLQLGMAPGDELYFFLEAQDNRSPVANHSRSETFFIVWEDTAAGVPLASNGLLINPLPEYFRSQRQIIIDTEKLTKDRYRISVAELQKRSQNLGFDQRALRMRYGEYLGEEMESGTVRGAEQEGEQVDKSAADDKTSAVERIVGEFEHQHDSAENATLFAPTVKTLLKAALAEMWNAELHLRMFHPDTALPFEYRALALLKSVQQHNRVYVQRVGFNADPIKEEKRLSGDLEKVQNHTVYALLPHDSTLHEVRMALQLLRTVERTQALPSSVEIAALRRVSRELGRAVLKQSGQSLRALQNYHAVLADFESRRMPCDSCLEAAQQALWQLLPTPVALPTQRIAFESRLAQKYFEKLER